MVCGLLVWLFIIENGCKAETFPSYVVCITQCRELDTTSSLHSETMCVNVCVRDDEVCWLKYVSASVFSFAFVYIRCVWWCMPALWRSAVVCAYVCPSEDESLASLHSERYSVLIKLWILSQTNKGGKICFFIYLFFFIISATMKTSLVIQTSVRIKSYSGRGGQRSHHS